MPGARERGEREVAMGVEGILVMELVCIFTVVLATRICKCDEIAQN